MSMVGRIDMRFTLQEENVSAGAVSGAWEDITTFWGRLYAINPSDGSTHNLLMRTNPKVPIMVGQRILFDEKAYLICQVQDNFGDKKWLTVQVKEEEYLN